MRPFVGGKGSTNWFSSSSATDLSAPRIDAAPADIYIHKNRVEGTSQLWLYSLPSGWVGLSPDNVVEHPWIPGRVLRIREDGEPSWILEASYQTMKARRGKARASSVA